MFPRKFEGGCVFYYGSYRDYWNPNLNGVLRTATIYVGKSWQEYKSFSYGNYRDYANPNLNSVLHHALLAGAWVGKKPRAHEFLCSMFHQELVS
jgi:hypothetical protein